VQAKIEKFGDDFGLRIPKPLMDACGLGEEVDVTVRDKTLVVAAREPARAGWEEAIESIPQEAIDRDFEELRDFREMPNEWDAQGWQWPQTAPDEKV
jgi:antitoxin component of MazEF toxin-antitoxin module